MYGSIQKCCFASDADILLAAEDKEEEEEDDE